VKPAELRAARAGAQLLAGEQARSAEEVVERLLAVQTQDLGAGMLSLRARVHGLAIPDVEDAINRKAIVTTWVNRGTIHMLRPDDLPWLLALTAPTQHTGALRRLATDGVSAANAAKAVDVMVRALADEGPLKREDLRTRVKQAGLDAEGRALVHLLFHASYEGHIVRGPIVGRQHLFVRTQDWLGRQPEPPPRERALAELARRYLKGFGPATAADLAYWAGLPLRDARSGLEQIASELTHHDGFVDLKRRAPAPRRLPAKLLPLWDDALVGHKDKTWLGEAGGVFAGGMIGPAATRAGRVIGKWSAADGRVVVQPFDGASAHGFAAEIRDVQRFLATRPA
jgi:hypothetical protein